MSDSWDSMDCSLPGSSVHKISKTRILEQAAISFFRGSSWPRDRSWVSCVAGGFFTDWATVCRAVLSHSVVALCDPWACSPPVHEDSLGKNTRVGCHALLQGIFPTQGSNPGHPGLPDCRWILYLLSHQGSPRRLEWVACPFCRGYSWPRDWTGVSYIAGEFFTSWATREAVSHHTALQLFQCYMLKRLYICIYVWGCVCIYIYIYICIYIYISLLSCLCLFVKSQLLIYMCGSISGLLRRLKRESS